SLGRITAVVQALRVYTHRDHRGTPAVTDLAEQIDAVLELSKTRLGGGIRILRDYAGLPKYRCYTDKLQQVWMALIDNALDAVGETGTLAVHGRETSEGIKVSVEDSGPGIPEDLAHRIFEPFFTTKPAGEGYGLGLATALEIVRSHRGRLEFESRPGRTVFTVSLPSAGIVPVGKSSGKNRDD
ncbi:MAG: HAMP domain-containing histidine kinase, partial [Treponema sp.]|nr:HAMP domain-containing histidine kinase [Treponema sp.]